MHKKSYNTQITYKFNVSGQPQSFRHCTKSLKDADKRAVSIMHHTSMKTFLNANTNFNTNANCVRMGSFSPSVLEPTVSMLSVSMHQYHLSVHGQIFCVDMMPYFDL